MDCVLQSGKAQRARPCRFSAGTHDECIKEWLQTVAWPQLGGGSSRDVAYPVNKPKGAGSCTGPAAAGTGKSIDAARSMHPHLGKRGAEGGGGDEASSALGQKMDQARARFRRAVESGEKAMQVLQKAQENFEQVQQKGMQAQIDLEMPSCESCQFHKST